MTSEAFTGDGQTLAPEWSAQIDALLDQIKDKPSLIRIAHRAADAEQASRLADDIRKRWEAHGDYPLTVELEVWGALP